MGFYEKLSKYYDYIFPVGQSQINFIGSFAGSPPKTLLDVACGSGGYSIALSKAGYALTAVDLDEKMLERTMEKAEKEGVHVDAFRCDMKELEKAWKERQGASSVAAPFDLVFCIGNSLVHLGTIGDIKEALRQMGLLLGKQGILLLQIINYDRIIGMKINELPPIENEQAGLKFLRKYRYNEEKGTISFDTVLDIDQGGNKEKYENSIELLPLLMEDLRGALEEVGFHNIQAYGDFNFTPYEKNSYMLVLKAEKLEK